MGFDRSKYKAASLSDIKSQEDRQQAIRPSKQFNGDNHDIDGGDNWFRLAPFHPDKGGSSPFVAKCVSFLEVKVPKRDDNKQVIEGQFEQKQKPIFNSKVHGGVDVDLVEEYMRVAKDLAIPSFTDDKEVQKAIWKQITDYDNVKKRSGLKPKDSWECYAWNRAGKLATLGFGSTVKNQLNALAANLSQDPQSPDPYTDPEDGIAIIINKTGEQLTTKYTVRLDSRMVDKFNSQLIPTPLTDDQMQIFDKTKSLHERFVNSFKRKDLDYQIEGLQNFDKRLKADGYDISVFQYDEFLDIIEALYEAFPEEAGKEAEQKEEKPTTNVPKKLAPKVETKAEVKKTVIISRKPVVTVEEEVQGDTETDVAEEEVKEPIVPKKVGNKSVDVAPKGEHIDNVQSKLDAFRKKMALKK